MKTIIGCINRVSPNLPSVNDTPARRLAFFRALASSFANNDWRKARAAQHAPEDSPLSPGFNTENPGTKYEKHVPIMYAWSNQHMRGEQWADDVEYSGIDHKGWFTDADCSATLRAFVFSLSRGRFGAGYQNSDSGETVYFLRVFDRARDAAQFGNEEARVIAEREQEYSEHWQAAQDLHTDILDHVRNLGESFALRNHRKFGEQARARVPEIIEALRAARERMATEFKDVEVG